MCHVVTDLEGHHPYLLYKRKTKTLYKTIWPPWIKRPMSSSGLWKGVDDADNIKKQMGHLMLSG